MSSPTCWRELAGTPRPHRLLRLGRERDRRVARRRRRRTNGKLDERSSTCELGLADPFSVRRRTCGNVWIARSTMHESPTFSASRNMAQFHANLCAMRSPPPRRHRQGILHLGLRSITYYVGITYVPAFLISAGALTEKSRSGCPPPQRSWSSWSLRSSVFCPTYRPPAGTLALCLGSAALPISIVRTDGKRIPTSGSARRRCACRPRRSRQCSRRGRNRRTVSWRRSGDGSCSGRDMATAVFGGLTPYAAQLLVERTRWSMAPGAMIALVALCVLPVFVTMRETAPISARPTPLASS